MSQGGVEPVRAAPEASKRPDIEADFAEVFDPAVRLELSVRVFDPEVYEGYEAIMRWCAFLIDRPESL